jgi:hypothetical protein
MTTTPRALQTRFSQHALSLGLAALVTAGALQAVLGLAGADHAAQLAQRQQAVPQAIAQVLLALQA